MRVFFDVDGVLLDGWHAQPDRRKPWDLTLEQDLGIARDALQRALFLPTAGGEAAILPTIRGETDLKDVLADLLPTLGYGGSVEEFLAYWFRNDSNLNHAVLDVVRRLRACDGLSLYLATSQEHHRAAYLWRDLAFEALFDDIFYSARLGATKDQEAFFARVNAQLGIAEGDRPLFFDDTERNVLTARAAGWDAHRFDSVDDLLGNPRLASLLAG